MILSQLFVIAIHLIGYGYTTSSGFYIDNGELQTVRDTEITLQDLQKIEQNVLDMLRLPDRPNKDHIRASKGTSSVQFLLNIHHKLSEGENKDTTGRRVARDVFHASSDLPTLADESDINKSDLILTFLTKEHQNMPKVRHDSFGERLVFDTSAATADDVLLLYATLKVYKNSTFENMNRISGSTMLTIKFSFINSSDSDHNLHELDYFAHHTVPYDYQGWIEIDATKVMHRWMADSVRNMGIFAEVFSTETPQKQIKPQDVGLILSNKIERYQPFLVGYYKSRALPKPTSDVTHKKRSIVGDREGKTPFRKLVKPRNPLLDIWSVKEKNCQINTLYVSFRDLGWDDWIFAPYGFEAFFCHGECRFPLNTHMNATNHAIIQTLVHQKNPNVPKPCCVPTQLAPISVVYQKDGHNFGMMMWQNMVVKSCGCH